MPSSCPWGRAHQRRTEASGSLRAVPEGAWHAPSHTASRDGPHPSGSLGEGNGTEHAASGPGTMERKGAERTAPPPHRRAGYTSSGPVTGWISVGRSCWRLSACSPVTRNTTRLATATAWSAKRS